MPTILRIYTFDENGFAKTVDAPSCTNYVVSYADVDKEGSGRNPLTGEMYRERIGSYIKLDLTWDLIPGTIEYQNWYKVLTQLPKSFRADYLDPSSSELVTKTFYRTDIQTELYLFIDEKCNIWKGLSTSFVQNDVSSFSNEGITKKEVYLGRKKSIILNKTLSNPVVANTKKDFSNFSLISESELKNREYNKNFYKPSYGGKFISCEEKRVTLDGSFEFLDKVYSTSEGVKDSPIFWWTNSMCKVDGTFATNPKLEINGRFREGSYTIVFGEVTSSFKIGCYLENGDLGKTISIENNAEKEYIFELQEEYVKLVVEIIKIDNSVSFGSQNGNYRRFAKVNTLYGGIFKYLNEKITDLEITQEFSVDNSEFNANVFTLKLNDEKSEYDPQNADNKLSQFKELPITIDVYVKRFDSLDTPPITEPLVKTFTFTSENNTYAWSNQVLSVTNYSRTYNLTCVNNDETPQFDDNTSSSASKKAKTLTEWLGALNVKSTSSGIISGVSRKDLDSEGIQTERYTNDNIKLNGYLSNNSSYSEELRKLVEASYVSEYGSTTGQYRTKMVMTDYDNRTLLFKTQLLETNLKFYGWQSFTSDLNVEFPDIITRNYVFSEEFEEAKPKNYIVKIYTYKNVDEVETDDKGNQTVVGTKVETSTYDRSYILDEKYETETIDNPFITSDWMENPQNWSTQTSTTADRLVAYRQKANNFNTYNFETNYNGGIIEPGHTYVYENKYGVKKAIIVTKVILNGSELAQVEAKEVYSL